jgi:pyruvyltransferase
VVKVAGVESFQWNPRRKRLPYLRPRHNNFGDLLGPVVVREMITRLGRLDSAANPARSPGHKLMTVGSVMHFAQDGDTVWGTGVNGKVRPDEHLFGRLDVRAVRGPRTRAWLENALGIDVPAVYGDPALLLPRLIPSLGEAGVRKRRSLSVIPNMNEASKYKSHPDFVSPRRSVREVVSAIASSDRVVGSSLHAIVLAEAMGVPCALVRSSVESPFKYADYFEGTGRFDAETFDSFDSALAHVDRVDVDSYAPLQAWDAQPLMAAFPADLWTNQADGESNDAR